MSSLAIAQRDYRVETGLPRDYRAARLLLGKTAHPFLHPRILVARSNVGVIAAACLFVGPLNPFPGLRMALSVATPFRKRGIGTQLVERAIDYGKSRQAKALYAPASIEPDGEEHGAWNSLGFQSGVTEIHYESNPHDILASLAPIRARVQEHGRIPQNARVIPLREAPYACVADLHARYLGGHTSIILAKIEGRAPDPFDIDNSLVLMMGERVAGFILGREVEKGVGMTESTVVIPELRFSWANLLLKTAAAERAIDLGRHASRFITYDRHVDTRKLAQMVGAKIIKTAVIPYRRI